MLTANRIHHLLNSVSPLWQELPSHQHTPRAAAAQSARIWGNEQTVLIEVDLPGLTLEGIRVEAEKNSLSIAVKTVASESAGNGEPASAAGKEETPQARFELPFPVEADLTDVVYRHGVLRITVQRPADDLPRKLNVRHAN